MAKKIQRGMNPENAKKIQRGMLTPPLPPPIKIGGGVGVWWFIACRSV